MDLDAFFGGLFEVFRGSAHFAGLFEADDMHFFSAEATGHEGRVEADAAAAHDDHALAHFGAQAERRGAEEFNGLHRGFGTGDGQAVFLGGAGGDDDGVVRGAHVGEGDVAADHGVDAGAHADFEDPADFAVNDVAGQTEVRHAVAGHAAEHGVGLVHGDVMAEKGEEVRGGEAGGAAADDADALARGGTALEQRGAVGGVVEHGAFKGAGVHAGVVSGAVAVGLAEVGADAAGDAGKGVFGAQVAQGFTEFALFHKRLHLLDGIACGAEMLARRGAELLLEAVAHDYGQGDFTTISRRHDNTP